MANDWQKYATDLNFTHRECEEFQNRKQQSFDWMPVFKMLNKWLDMLGPCHNTPAEVEKTYATLAEAVKPVNSALADKIMKTFCSN